jgi:hypothetical protein
LRFAVRSGAVGGYSFLESNGKAGWAVRTGFRPRSAREWFTTWAELGWVCAPDRDSIF